MYGGIEKMVAPLLDAVETNYDQCVHCRGRGFIHNSSMQHQKREDERCFFCQTCNTCGGRGTLQSQTHIVSNGFTQQVVSDRAEPCVRCNGNGFCHDSSMKHDKGPNQRCFFCKDCSTCGGSGVLQGTTEVVSNIFGGASVIDNRPQACMRCRGNGYVHESSMRHDKGPDEKCFFCKKCGTCAGSGVISSFPHQSMAGYPSNQVQPGPMYPANNQFFPNGYGGNPQYLPNTNQYQPQPNYPPNNQGFPNGGGNQYGGNGDQSEGPPPQPVQCPCTIL